MNDKISYMMTNDSITVVLNGKPTTVRRGAGNFQGLRQALLEENWDAVPGLMSVAKALADWAGGLFQVDGDQMMFAGEPIPQALNTRINEMVVKGEDPKPLLNFWQKLQKNPSKRSVDQLWSFLQHQGIPLTPDGNFLAYKGVRSDFKDAHSGTFDNSPGNVHEMPRNKISDDPNEPCHEGFHVGAREYAASFSQRMVICEVDPADVVCVPYDYSSQKMRVSRYKVVGLDSGQILPSTTFSEPDYDEDDQSIADSYDENDGEDDDLGDSDDDNGDCPNCNDPDCDGCDDGDCEDPYCMGCDVCDPGGETMDEVKNDLHPAPTPPRAPKKVAKKFDRFSKMTDVQLLECSMEELRRYASQGLKIVGAYRIPGGKVALVSAILLNR